MVVECEVDDLPGEGFGFLMERLLGAGALDVYFTPVQMKKNRPGTLVTLLCRPAELEPLAAILLAESGSLGCRFHRAARLEAERESGEVDTPTGRWRSSARASTAGRLPPRRSSSRCGGSPSSAASPGGKSTAPPSPPSPRPARSPANRESAAGCRSSPAGDESRTARQRATTVPSSSAWPAAAACAGRLPTSPHAVEEARAAGSTSRPSPRRPSAGASRERPCCCACPPRRRPAWASCRSAATVPSGG